MEKELTVLIIEDENLASKKLKKILNEIDPNLKCLEVLDSIESSVAWLESKAHPDLILMDIELADGQSFEIFSQTDIKCPVIFTTAYDEFALNAFKVNSVDYLLKPIQKSDLEKALNKWKSIYSQAEKGMTANPNFEKLFENLISQQSVEFKTRFLVKFGHRLIPVSTDEISCFYSEEKVVFIKTFANQRYMTDYILEDLEKLVNPKSFFRANRQFIINNKSIQEIEQWFNGKLKVKITPSTIEEIIISREKAPEFKVWITQ